MLVLSLCIVLDCRMCFTVRLSGSCDVNYELEDGPDLTILVRSFRFRSYFVSVFLRLVSVRFVPNHQPANNV